MMLLGGLAGMFLISVLALGTLALYPSAPPMKTSPTISAPEIRMKRVLVSIHEIENGAALHAAQFRVESRPAGTIERGSIESFEEMRGLFAKSTILAGHPLYRDQLTSTQPINQVISSIPAGHRAVAIRTDVEQAVEGWVQPGVFIDLDWITTLGGQPKLLRIVRKAKVISAERDTKGAGNSSGRIPSTITIAVTDEDSQFLNLARSNGKLEIALRGEGVESTPSNSKPVGIKDIWQRSSGEADAAPKCSGEITLGPGQYLYLSSRGQWVDSKDNC